MAITREAWEQAQKNPVMLGAIWRYAMMEAGQQRVDAWLREVGLHERVQVGVVAIWMEDCEGLAAYAKVLINDVPPGQFFEHEEYPYLSFPSDHFKTKVLLATGGA